MWKRLSTEYHRFLFNRPNQTATKKLEEKKEKQKLHMEKRKNQHTKIEKIDGRERNILNPKFNADVAS